MKAKKKARREAAAKRDATTPAQAVKELKGIDLQPLPVPPVAPQDVHQVLFAFPAVVIGTLLPKWEDIPESFRNYNNCGPWGELASRWFFSSSGIGPPMPKDAEFHAKPGIDAEKAWRHIETCFRSFEPKHEHKMSGAAWLMECFLEKVVIPSEKKEYKRA